MADILGHVPPSPELVSLRRVEALERSREVAVTGMVVELDLTRGDTLFASTTTITFDTAHCADTFVNFQGEQLLAASLNGSPVDSRTWTQGRLPLTPCRPRDNTLVVQGLMAYSSDGEGLHRHVDPADGQLYLYAMSFLDAAPRWFACFDQPDLKAPYELQVTAPVGWTVLGNGPSEVVAPGQWRIRSLAPLSTYYVTLVAGPYASVLDEHDGIPLGLHVRASLRDSLEREAVDLFAVTKAAFDYFHGVFGIRYPFGEYHQAFVPDFNAGAMENPGCVTLRDQYIYRGRATRSERAHRAGTVVHEMAHMWFGDLVTMTWWDDLWLNESFAEYMAHRACEEAGEYRLWTEFGIARKDWGLVADQAPSTHPVAGNGSVDAAAALQAFDGISYAKGAAVLKQLAAHLGDDVFFSGLRAYFTDHAFGNADFADLMSAWTAAGAVDLTAWAAGWLRTSGLDTIDVVLGDPVPGDPSLGEPVPGDPVPGDRVATITRTPPSGQDVSRSHAIQLGVVNGSGQLLDRAAVHLADAAVVLPLTADASLVIPDVGDETWAKIRFGPDGWAKLPTVLPGLEDASARVVVYNSLRDAVRSAQLHPATALDLICQAVVTEPSEVVLSSVLEFAQRQLAGPFSPPGQRAERRLRIHETARAVLDAAEPGSDRQLAAFRRVISSCDDVEEHRAWLASLKLPDGVALDSELTWAMVTRVAVLAADADLVEATVREDPSGVSLSYAARARAALPTAEAKVKAWQLLMQPSSIGAYELYATAEGFFDPAQAELTDPYARRYFEDIVETASFRTGWALGQVALLGYPAPAARQDIVDLADLGLARPDLAAPLRRALLDCTDRLRRAVAALRLQSPAGVDD